MPHIETITVGPQAENCYIVSLPEHTDCVVIDPGAEAERIRQAIGSRTIAAILLTHCHGDHIGAVEALRAGGVPVYIHAADQAGLGDTHLNVSAWLGKPLIVSPAEYEVTEGQHLTLAGIPFTVLHTPGHTAGSVCYQTEGAIFTGDTVLCGTCGRTDLPTGSEAQMRASLRRLLPILETMPYYGGHA